MTFNTLRKLGCFRPVVLPAFVLCCVAAIPLCAPAQSPAPASSTQQAAIALAQSRLDTLLKTGHADPAWFADSFLAQYPADKVDGIVAQLKGVLGEYKSIEFSPDGFVAHFEKGTDLVLITLDAQNKISGLFFKPPAISQI